MHSIKDPAKCVWTIGADEIDDLVPETAVATLTNIVRSAALDQIAQSKQISLSTQSVATSDGVTFRNEKGRCRKEKVDVDCHFFDRAHQEFMRKLQGFASECGIDFANIRMESFNILDTKLANEMSQNFVTKTNVENELVNLEGQNLIATKKEQTGAECENIKTAAEVKSLRMCGDAENTRKLDAARAEAEAMKVRSIANLVSNTHFGEQHTATANSKQHQRQQSSDATKTTQKQQRQNNNVKTTVQQQRCNDSNNTTTMTR